MKRVLVTGNAGAGKSTFGRALATRSGVPYFGLDGIVWRPGWQKTNRADRHEAEQAIASRDSWIVDGVSDELLKAADTIVLPDVPRLLCILRVLWRSLPYLFRSRPGLPERCPELLILPQVAKIIWKYPATQRTKVFGETAARPVTLFHIRNRAGYLAAMSSLHEGLTAAHESSQ